MHAWPAPDLPRLPGRGPRLKLYDTASGTVRRTRQDQVARMYVCGVTPYDSTHLGHAATYLTFDLIARVLQDGGREVDYVQNVTDVDDPLLERAAATNEDWRALADREIERFRTDMTWLRAIPPRRFVGAVEAIAEIAAVVEKLRDDGCVYELGDDLYYSVDADPEFGRISGYDEETMLACARERGGDPDRQGKRNPLDPLLWRAERPGEPAWASRVGRGRPGWHIECTTIALNSLGPDFDIQGGGKDLVFPHHECSASHARRVSGLTRFAEHYVHPGSIGLEGVKMSKSLGNLVFVHRLRTEGADGAAIRVALFAHHYRADRDWRHDSLDQAQATVTRWRQALGLRAGPPAAPLLAEVRDRLSDDLDTPAVLRAVNRWTDEALDEGGEDRDAPHLVRKTLDALLGLA
ncbi:cysteine--1-D-myo-inosityl 2-amino-2-deoxy-alpha-D-glucopyranoside ligase [Actinomadura sp. ATCC 31491]|uniref:L-cysteine:1D-myo-inositol 2-amino-2-deoxy-alpha-D-glucopyranoside ligase n=1 Tax=Actinomadura luzonensis TaxID=2805427 RepID=A0ABT0FJB2_9ACTN|nr:cysteine--1-D-myo-inosityl 2-amino-2-deoxy-alpha-D-glucopyranoside ligase [Actinomadura luzonensis]MCK2212392.1 cysteine--1-D-myo-inosityl 2-amino-2-deoxy-alpha-D-glucopyranoside ligase [Actinomadura luzonensis]